MILPARPSSLLYLMLVYSRPNRTDFCSAICLCVRTFKIITTLKWLSAVLQSRSPLFHSVLTAESVSLSARSVFLCARSVSLCARSVSLCVMSCLPLCYTFVSAYRCDAERLGRRTCTGPQSGPCRSADFAPSEKNSLSISLIWSRSRPF